VDALMGGLRKVCQLFGDRLDEAQIDPRAFISYVRGASQVRDYLKAVRDVELYLRTMQAKLESLAPATAQKNINLDAFQQIAVRLPPIQEQAYLVEVVDEWLSLAKQAASQLEHDILRGSRLRQSILKRAFEGKLVPQDPNDEPASVLLERIRKARAAESMPRAPKRRKSPA
jgi:type I restriction enzyme S subunit